jgi:outer membrane murein-binding lipoprotein Lpp
MIRMALMAVLMGASMGAVAADDLKVSQLEQDVRELQRQVQALSRQIEMQRAQSTPAPQMVRPKTSSAAGSGETPAWVDAARWQKLQPGMSELEVVTTLGPPTSMRVEGGQRILLYALEIGSSGFLGGSVTLRDRAVINVQKPVLQ